MYDFEKVISEACDADIHSPRRAFLTLEQASKYFRHMNEKSHLLAQVARESDQAIG